MTGTEVRKTREYRIATAMHTRANPRCICCGAIKGRAVHHLNSVSYFPEQACDLDNMVTLCDYRAKNSHTLFHCVFKKSFREKCTKEDFNDFLEVINFKNKEITI